MENIEEIKEMNNIDKYIEEFNNNLPDTSHAKNKHEEYLIIARAWDKFVMSKEDIRKDYLNHIASGLMKETIEKHIHKYFSTFVNEYWDDMYNEACIRILENIDRYNPLDGSFEHYFKKHIHGAISDYIATNIYKTTNYYNDKNTKIKRFLEDENNSNLSNEEIAKKLNISPKAVKFCRYQLNQTDVEFEEKDIISDKSTEDIVVTKLFNREMMNAINKHLDKDEKMILFCHLGIEPYKKCSDVHLGKLLNCSDNTVKRRREKIIKKLVNLPYFKNYF